MQKKSTEIMQEVKKVIVGKDDVIRKVLMVILAGGHVLLEDVPGVGKTQLALSFSRAMDLQYRRMQFTPDTMASDITGFSVYDRGTGQFTYKEGAAMCNLFLADEINRTSAKTQAALLEVMEEGAMTVDGITHTVPHPFICIATQNPLGSAGTQKLPDSQLDRFMVKLSMGYPEVGEQVEIIKQRQGSDPIDSVVTVADGEEILAMRREVDAVRAVDDVLAYAAQLCENTRRPESVDQGVSPRAVLALVQMAKAGAYIDDRDYLTPEDIKDSFFDVCRHRLILTARARIRKETEDEVLRQILEDTPVPQVLGR
ncbi:MAG: AAA family ATPase [Anaerovoracaceae bacterium]|jgi:MoxR-like ATPase